MGRPPKYGRNSFGVMLEEIMKENSLTPGIVANASGIKLTILSNMMSPMESRINRDLVLQCIEGLIDLNAIKGVPRANEFLTGSGFEELNAKYPNDKKIYNALERKKRQQLIGRRRDIDAIYKEMLVYGTRFLTLTGVKGVGKTAIAKYIQVNALTQAHFFKIYFVPLAGIESVDEAFQRIYTEVRDIDPRKPTLLILDNVEDIQDRMNARNRINNELVDKYPKLSILATSSKAFSEKSYPVKTLDVPQSTDELPEKIQAYDAVKLFLASANVNRKPYEMLTVTEHNAQTIAQICIGLDGIPLFLRLAGSWVKKLEGGVEGVYKSYQNGELHELPAPFPDNKWHVSVDKAIEKSYTLLEKDEQGEQKQALFRRLAIFAGKCSVETAITVCSVNDDLPKHKPDFMNIVNSLSEDNLITFENEMIEIAHNTQRDFAWIQLQEDPQKDTIIAQLINFYNLHIIDYIDLRYNPKRLMQQGRVALEELRFFLLTGTTLRFHEGASIDGLENVLQAYNYIREIRHNYLAQATETCLKEDLFDLTLWLIPPDRDILTGDNWDGFDLPQEVYLLWDYNYLLNVKSVLDAAKERGYKTKEDEETINKPFLEDRAPNITRAYWEAPYRDWVYWALFFSNELNLPPLYLCF
jgi:hypothetical protein